MDTKIYAYTIFVAIIIRLNLILLVHMDIYNLEDDVVFFGPNGPESVYSGTELFQRVSEMGGVSTLDTRTGKLVLPVVNVEGEFIGCLYLKPQEVSFVANTN